jgi:hypothetical protein
MMTTMADPPGCYLRVVPRRVVPRSGDGGSPTRPVRQEPRPGTPPSPSSSKPSPSRAPPTPTRRYPHRWGGSTPPTPLLSVQGCEWGPTPLSSLTSTHQRDQVERMQVHLSQMTAMMLGHLNHGGGLLSALCSSIHAKSSAEATIDGSEPKKNVHSFFISKMNFSFNFNIVINIIQNYKISYNHIIL